MNEKLHREPQRVTALSDFGSNGIKRTRTVGLLIKKADYFSSL
jgi:hypothetical protein